MKHAQLINALPTAAQFCDLIYDVHQANVAAGWWSDLQTGESIIATRNRSEVMMLIQSEYLEGYEGLLEDKMDDHLPHRSMYAVELADAAIRELDLLGAEQAQFNDSMIASVVEYVTSRDLQICGWVAAMVFVNNAFEHFRKGRKREYIDEIITALIFTFILAEYGEIPLLEIIAEKRAYNLQRADHKRESRLAAGGKAI